MKTAQEIIQEALDYQYEKEPTAGWERFLYNTSFDKGRQERAKSGAILYITDRFMAEEREKEIAIRREARAFDIAKQCVEIYGPEALKMLYEHWNYLDKSNPSNQGAGE